MFSAPIERRDTLHKMHDIKKVGITDADRFYSLKVYTVNLMIYWIFFVITGYIVWLLWNEVNGDGIRNYNLNNPTELLVFYMLFLLLILIKIVADIYVICLWADWNKDPIKTHSNFRMYARFIISFYEFFVCLFGLIAITNSSQFFDRWERVIERAGRFIQNKDLSGVIILWIIKIFNYVLIIYYSIFIFVRVMVFLTYLLIALYFWSWNGLSWMGFTAGQADGLENKEVEEFLITKS